MCLFTVCHVILFSKDPFWKLCFFFVSFFRFGCGMTSSYRVISNSTSIKHGKKNGSRVRCSIVVKPWMQISSGIQYRAHIKQLTLGKKKIHNNATCPLQGYTVYILIHSLVHFPNQLSLFTGV